MAERRRPIFYCLSVQGFCIPGVSQGVNSRSHFVDRRLRRPLVGVGVGRTENCGSDVGWL